MKKFALTFKSLIRGDSVSINWTVTAEDIEEAEMDWVTNCQMHMTKEAKFDMCMETSIRPICRPEKRYGDVDGD